jgi:hypothetical protein
LALRHEDRRTVMGKVQVQEEVAAADERAALPERVQEALGELVGAAKEGLLALSVGVGLGVLHELMGSEVEEGLWAEGQARPAAGSPIGTAAMAGR